MNHVGDIFVFFYMEVVSSYGFLLLFGPLYEETPLVINDENDIMRHIGYVIESFGIEGALYFFFDLLRINLHKYE